MRWYKDNLTIALVMDTESEFERRGQFNALISPAAIVSTSHSLAPSKCRGCGESLSKTFIDLGYSPLANSYLNATQLNAAEKSYPLRVFVCEKCFLVQLEEFESPDAIFSDYAYFSSFSTSWVEHARRYCDMMVERFGFGSEHRVIEIASNDGYLLQWFKAKGITVLGVEPAANIAMVAWLTKGIPSSENSSAWKRPSRWSLTAIRQTCCWEITCSLTFPMCTISSAA